MKGLGVVAGAVLAMLPMTAQASETVTYTYDVLGRLVKVERSGTVNDGVSVEYNHDKADNRTQVETKTASNAPA